ncbi:glycosyltransferase family A protein [Caulobacter sp. BP25]|uniref:glycosyltransferase family 2 protein n=1 Tax=Caulobacter sp. BP25 TaxID=2048900 RepID=UPI00137479DB|nr:glycosyltransferase family A protein [Caulobacter sp. BP25]
MAPKLVSVVIPAYNAASTLDRTLKSVCDQTYAALEILVVDDGSQDETAQIAHRWAARDGRVRLLTQPNSGVAAARNLGVAEAKGDLIAPVDADDLWAPEKIEKQLAALEALPEAALAYCWFALIDAHDKPIRGNSTPTYSGDVLRHICRGNFIGNGSAPLIRKAAILEAGGYDSSLRAQRAQGCEDYLLYYRIARSHPFACVPEVLLGYRQTPDNMSGDVLQMLRSWDLVREEMLRESGSQKRDIKAADASLKIWLFARAVSARRFDAASKIAQGLLRSAPSLLLWFLAKRALGRILRPLRGLRSKTAWPLGRST